MEDAAAGLFLALQVGRDGYKMSYSRRSRPATLIVPRCKRARSPEPVMTGHQAGAANNQ